MGDSDYSFWAFCKLCDLRDELCPEDYQKIDDFIMEWYHKDMDVSHGLHEAFYHTYDMEAWWKYRPIKPSELLGLMGITTGILDQVKQLTKIEDHFSNET